MSHNRLRTTATAAGAVLLATVLGVTLLAPAAAAREQRLSPRTHFTMAADGSSGATKPGAGIPNIDSVKSTIRTYYNATNGIADKSRSPYISEMKSIARSQWRYLDRVQRQARKQHKRPAIVFDADDTTLWTYDMEDAAMHFNFDPALQDVWVQDKRFPATPSMVKFVNQARERASRSSADRPQRRPEEGHHQEPPQGRLPGVQQAHLLHQVDRDGREPAAVVHQVRRPRSARRSSTRPAPASTSRRLGYDIVLNVGDQWSDLQGGYADRVLKLPNPTYFLPSPDLDGTPADRAFSPRTHFTMKPDGSSGATQGGEGIPNIDSVKSTIRTYYNATDGIADKSTSPYISELAALTARKTSRLTQVCANAKAAGEKPAIVFDADDTTLWTYDMEDNAMHFNFDPVAPGRVGPGQAVPGDAGHGGSW